MRVAFIGGTRFVGPAAVARLRDAGHEVAIAHSGVHEHPAVEHFEHLHGTRDELLATGGPVEAWRPEALVDTFAGGASAAKALALAACAARSGASHVVAISSVDVYQHTVEAGIGDGSGAVPFPRQPLPLDETAPLRDGPYPGAHPGHDNVAMEEALHDAGQVTALRPGAIYGPAPGMREWELVRLVRDGTRRLELPDGGDQLFHRVANERLARGVVAALERAPDGFWACNVVDPYDWSYAGLAGRVGALLDWEWEPVTVPFAATEHPWQTRHAVVGSDRRLREVLGVTEPDPAKALEETVRWLWDNRKALPDAA
jgi:nucleoside-diphosphate-sugar epimerase